MFFWNIRPHLFAVCKDSYVVCACGFDRVGKWEWFAESMRITVNTVIFMHLCHLVLDHWRGKTLFFNVILGNSLQILVIHKSVWNWFSAILGDSQISLKMILDDSWQFSAIHESVWNWFSVFLKSVSNCFGVILHNSWWFANHSEIILGVILGDSRISLKLFWGDSQPHHYITLHHDTWWCCIFNKY